MKKQAIGFLGILAGIAVAVGLAALPTLAQTALAATTSVGTFASTNHATASGSSSTVGPAGSSAGSLALCPNFVSFRGSCSEAA